MGGAYFGLSEKFSKENRNPFKQQVSFPIERCRAIPHRSVVVFRFDI